MNKRTGNLPKGSRLVFWRILWYDDPYKGSDKMINFQKLSPSQREQYNNILFSCPPRGCEYSFANLSLWGLQKVAYLHGCVAFFSHFFGRSVYPYPIGNGDRRAVIEDILQDAQERGLPCRIVGMTENDRAELEEWFPGKFLLKTTRNVSDYVYAIDDLADLKAEIDRAIVDEPPFTVREGGMIKEGYSPELDELRDIVANGQGYLATIEAQERERTGIKNLKVGYNRVFGYYIEVSKGQTDLVPETYIRKQTLTNCERYITPELKELETQGFEVTYLQPDENGTVTLAALREALRPDTILVSIMMVNNEVGSVMPIAQMAKLLGYGVSLGVHRNLRLSDIGCFVS